MKYWIYIIKLWILFEFIEYEVTLNVLQGVLYCGAACKKSRKQQPCFQIYKRKNM